MTGYSVRGKSGFVAKEGVNFSARQNVAMHADELVQIRNVKREDESVADFIRAAVREKLLRLAR